MKCACIETVEAKLPEHRIETAICFAGNQLEARLFSRLLRRDNGRVETRARKHTKVVFTFCPFCGQRYEPEPAVPKIADAAGSINQACDEGQATNG